MLKKPASFVLASLRGSEYGTEYDFASLAAASLDGHFEHPAWLFGVVSTAEICDGLRNPGESFRSLRENVHEPQRRHRQRSPG
jgi:hypothetical protein